jgi:hypothetical protein
LSAHALWARTFELLRSGGVAAAICGSLCLGSTNAVNATETSVLSAPRNASATATTVFKRPVTAAPVANTATPNEAAPLEWRVRSPKSASSASTAKSAKPAASESVVFKKPAQKSDVKLAQYEAEVNAADASGPVLRAANESVLLPPPSKASTKPTTAPKRLSPANPSALRSVKQAPDEDVTTRPRSAEPMTDGPADRSNPRRYAEEVPGETTTQPNTADDIFGNPSSPTTPAAPPAASDSPAVTMPPADAPTTETPAAPSEIPTTPAPPTAVDPPMTTDPPGRLTVPEESPLPSTPADARDAEIREFLFGRKDADDSRGVGELGDCDKTNKEVLGKRVIDISVDISPKASDIDSAWSYDRPWKDVTGKTMFVGRPLKVDPTSREAIFQVAGGGQRRVKLQDISPAEQGYFLAIYPLPIECPLIDETFEPRSWVASTYVWKASAACHKPLYFEDVHLERYGHSVGPILQPFASSAHFFATIPILPYKMGVHPPHECMYTLGYYRPGNCAPYMLDPIPLSARGALFQAGAVVGGVVAIP